MDEQSTNRTQRRKPRKKQTVFNSLPLLICLIVVGAVYFITGGFGLNRDAANTPTDPSKDTSETASPTETLKPDETEAPSETDAPDTEETEEPTEPSTEPPTTEPAVKSFTTVGSEYFDDALFIGDSRTNGLEIYDPPSSGADFYCGTSMTIFGVLDSTESVHGVTGLKNVLNAKQYGKIYIMFGINECGYATDKWIESYAEVLDVIRSAQPDAIIYVQSILYVTQAKERAMSVFSSDNLKEKNTELAKFDNGDDLFYLEVNDALNDGTDHLPSEYTGDGVHLKANYYYLWKDYLKEHAIVDAKHPAEPVKETEAETETETEAEAVTEATEAP